MRHRNLGLLQSCFRVKEIGQAGMANVLTLTLSGYRGQGSKALTFLTSYMS